MELDPVDVALASLRAATGASGVEALATKPAGTSVIASAWLIHTSAALGGPVDEQRGRAVRVRAVRPYSPRPVRATSPPSCWVSSWAP